MKNLFFLKIKIIAVVSLASIICNANPKSKLYFENKYYYTFEEFTEIGANSSQRKELVEKIQPYLTPFLKASGAKFKFTDRTGSECDLLVSAQHVVKMNPNILPKNDFVFRTYKTKPSTQSLDTIENIQSDSLESGEQVVLVGYPMGVTEPPSLSIGEVMSDESIQIAMSDPKAKGLIPYDKSVEHWVLGRSYQGFSGGPVFTIEGKWAGTLVRGSESSIDMGNQNGFYFRFIKSAYILKQLSAMNLNNDKKLLCK